MCRKASNWQDLNEKLVAGRYRPFCEQTDQERVCPVTGLLLSTTDTVRVMCDKCDAQFDRILWSCGYEMQGYDRRLKMVMDEGGVEVLAIGSTRRTWAGYLMALGGLGIVYSLVAIPIVVLGVV